MDLTRRTNSLGESVILYNPMKNKWMSREVQRNLPETTICRQCGISKIFCCYCTGNGEQEWIDPGVIGVAALITNKHEYSTYIRIYELDNVCELRIVYYSH